MAKINKGSSSQEQLLNEIKVLFDEFFFNIKRSVQPTKDDIPLPEGQFFLLFALWKYGKYKATDLSNSLGLTAGAVTAMADKLVDLQLIDRERSVEDRRVVWLSITEKGRGIIEKAQDNRFEHVRDSLAQLTEADLRKTVEIFSLLNSRLSKAI